jgi:hypothetical protein
MGDIFRKLDLRKNKACKICGASKPLSEFYRHSTMADGRFSSCKSCYIKQCAKYYNKHKKTILQRTRARDRVTYETKLKTRHAKWRAANKDKMNSYNKKYKANNQSKIRAHLAIRKAIENGIIARPKACESCGNITNRPLHGHHADYTKQLDVLWVCQPCHRKKHWKAA